ncbi:hypothetical protein C6501_19210 [Candidatus Poribacteria bacterium]|nr:MAG: hypothetical protein C6501_19210 [Candidatus Poribacteria bacterium]
MLKRFCPVLILLLAFGFSTTLLGNESVQKYFPGTLDSFWVYEDQDGNELTRYSIEDEEIAGETYLSFSYDPELEDWANYSCFIHPGLYNVNDEGITLVVGDAVENAVEARLKREMDMFVEIFKREIFSQAPPGVEMPTFNLDVETQGQDFLLLPENVVVDEEWDANQVKVNAKMIMEGAGASENEQLGMDFTIIETGIVLGTETVETIAGTFEDCLKVEYRTETTVTPPPDEVAPPGETVTTVWFAPNVGIIKLHQKSGYMILDMLPDDVALPPNQEKTLELKRYEIKTAESESDTEN